jgi:hypothetical protein
MNIGDLRLPWRVRIGDEYERALASRRQLKSGIGTPRKQEVST